MQIQNAMDAILDRRSVRQYRPDPISEEQYEAVMQAFDWAPTARNEQEIRAIVVRDGELLQAFARDFEAYGAKEGRVFKNFYFSAPMFIFLVGPRDFPFTAIDAGITAENMAIAAQSVGLGSLIIGCLRLYLQDEASAEWRKRFGIRDDEMFTVGVALGTPANRDQPKPKRKPGKITVIE